MDIDTISDITGINLSKIDYGEQDSEHSGSINSDNTELLLNQNISFQEFGADDSFLESVSQVGKHEHNSNLQNFSVGAKHNYPSHEHSFVESYPLQDGSKSEEFLSMSPIETQNAFFQGMKAQQFLAPNAEQIFEHSSKEDKQDFGPIMDNPVPASGHLTRKFPSDTNIVGSGRQSVIRHHSSMPSVNPEVSSGLHSSGIYNGYSSQEIATKQKYINGHEHKQAQQVQRDPQSFEKNFFLGELLKEPKYEREITEGLRQTYINKTFLSKPSNKEHLFSSDSEDKMKPYNRSSLTEDVNRNDVSRYESYHSSDTPGRPLDEHQAEVNRDNFEDCYHQVSFQEKNESYSGQELLLGVRHDPDTNELYDDKVREGADLLSRILGEDHNASFTSYSSTSRGSEKNEKTKSFSENRYQANQRSRNSSCNSEPRTKSSPRQHMNEQLSCSSSSNHQSRGPHFVAAPQKAAETVVETSGHNSAYVLQSWSKKQSQLTQEQASPGGVMVQRTDSEPQVLEHSSGYAKNGYDGRLTEKIIRTAEAGPNRRSSHNDEYEGAQVEAVFQRKIEELRRLEVDIEEIHSRKQMAMNELKVLEESVDRNKADMKSSESLVEQYRLQATQTRSELMDLEKTRNQLQEECNILNDVLQKSKRKETFNGDEILFGRSKDEIFTSIQERDKFKKELEMAQETLKREKARAKLAQDDLRDKIRSLEEDLDQQHQETVENLHMMKEQLDKERQKVRNLQHEKLNAINNLHDEMKELQEKEIDALKAQMLRERASSVELLEEKFKREAQQLRKAAESAEIRIKQLEGFLVERNEEISKIRLQHREEKQKNLDLEKQWRAQLESERQDAEIRMDGQERSCKDREEKLLRRQNELENLVEERTSDLRRCEERCRAQTEELQKVILNKNEEVQLVRGLVRQQEDATRVLGERLRTEAREHVRNAVEKERQSLSKEKERVNKLVEQEREKNTKTVKQLTEQIEMEKESHSQTKQIMNKLKHEAEELRKQVVEVHGERITSVQRARQEGYEELERIKEKLHEFTIQADKLERIDKETAKAIYEECRKIAEFVDMPVPFKTPTRLQDDTPNETTNGVEESPTKEALASLRQCNNKLRQRLADMKKQMDIQKTEAEQRKKSSVSSGSGDDLTILHQRLEEKEEEIRRLQKKYGDEISQLQEERNQEKMMYKKTIAKLEQEFQKLVTANPSVAAGSSRTNKKQIITGKGCGTSCKASPKYPQTSPLKTPFSSTEKSSSADLLKHLQDRVKKLRAENENLKRSSEKETTFNSVKHAGKTKGLNNSNSLAQSKNLTMSQLDYPRKGSDMKSRHNSGVINPKLDQVTQLQRLLTDSTMGDSTFVPTKTG